MLRAGWPPDARNHAAATAMHWAAFHGNAAVVRALLQRGARVDVVEQAFSGTPADWAQHGAKRSWHRASGDYAAVLELLAS
jgi:ankyrin repeat protein